MLSKHKNRSNIQMVKKMLSSKNDELRLLSFATINELEESIHAEIHKYNEKLEILDNSEYEKRAYINKKLALAYWELIYFQLADEALKKFILKKVEGYASSALRVLKNDESMYLLLGKVYLERKDDSIAIKYFNKSIEISESKNFSNSKYIVPYLAEISFNNRNFKDVKKMISEVDTFRQNQVLKPIYEIWS
ncbi:Extracellular Matrix protein PelE [hydrothermal vent metagenome]|uniref:Extracellular Matrix protein PelE n=1 Tax=hydrothermal vent metagenome TaxID=652676 RepID=A0A1W1ECV2_9ZZZZ